MRPKKARAARSLEQSTMTAHGSTSSTFRASVTAKFSRMNGQVRKTQTAKSIDDLRRLHAEVTQLDEEAWGGREGERRQLLQRQGSAARCLKSQQASIAKRAAARRSSRPWSA